MLPCKIERVIVARPSQSGCCRLVRCIYETWHPRVVCGFRLGVPECDSLPGRQRRKSRCCNLILAMVATGRWSSQPGKSPDASRMKHRSGDRELEREGCKETSVRKPSPTDRDATSEPAVACVRINFTSTCSLLLRRTLALPVLGSPQSLSFGNIAKRQTCKVAFRAQGRLSMQPHPSFR